MEESSNWRTITTTRAEMRRSVTLSSFSKLSCRLTVWIEGKRDERRRSYLQERNVSIDFNLARHVTLRSLENCQYPTRKSIHSRYPWWSERNVCHWKILPLLESQLVEGIHRRSNREAVRMPWRNPPSDRDVDTKLVHSSSSVIKAISSLNSTLESKERVRQRQE